MNESDNGYSAADQSSVEQLNPHYLVVRACQLEGNYNSEKAAGSWPISVARVSRGWGNITETDWPTKAEGSPERTPEPPDLDEKAKRFRIHHYQRVRSLPECLVMLGHRRPVQVAVEITEQWFDAEDGIIELPDSNHEIVRTHSVVILGFDFRGPMLIFANSWGEDWGNYGCGYLPFEYFENHVFDAWAGCGVCVRPPWFSDGATGLRKWTWPDPLGNECHGGGMLWGIDYYDATNDDRLGWAFAVQRDGYLDIEELFVKPTHRRQGIATQLIDGILDLAELNRRRIRMWIPLGDWNEETTPAVERITTKLGLTLFDTSERWAMAVGLDKSEFDHPIFRRRHPDFAMPPAVNWSKVIPPRPESVRRKKKGEKVVKKPPPGSTTSQTGPRMSAGPENGP